MRLTERKRERDREKEKREKREIDRQTDRAGWEGKKEIVRDQHKDRQIQIIREIDR